MKLTRKPVLIKAAAGSEAAQVLTAIMHGPNPPKTVGRLRDLLEQYEQDRVAILKKLAGVK